MSKNPSFSKDTTPIPMGQYKQTEIISPTREVKDPSEIAFNYTFLRTALQRSIVNVLDKVAFVYDPSKGKDPEAFLRTQPQIALRNYYRDFLMRVINEHLYYAIGNKEVFNKIFAECFSEDRKYKFIFLLKGVFFSTCELSEKEIETLVRKTAKDIYIDCSSNASIIKDELATKISPFNLDDLTNLLLGNVWLIPLILIHTHFGSFEMRDI